MNAQLRIENHLDARAARAQILASLREVASPDSDLSATELIVSELVGNAFKYGTGWVSLALEWEGERPVLHVCNGGSAFDLPAGLPEEPAAESGRGLFLVQSISLGLKIERVHDVNHVWAVLPVRLAKRSASRR